MDLKKSARNLKHDGKRLIEMIRERKECGYTLQEMRLLITRSVSAEVARNLPKSVRYYVVINETSNYTVNVNPKAVAPDVTAFEVMQAMHNHPAGKRRLRAV